jgi:predicted GTPase
MRAVRAVLLLALLLAPVLVLGAVAGWLMWKNDVSLWVWWLLPICWGLACLLARRWQQDLAPLPLPESNAPLHWTPRDKQAFAIVEAQERAVKAVPQERLTDPRFYLDIAIDLTARIARHYHPGARQPLDSLTVPEILAVAHLAFEDLEEWVRDYVPASHLLTVQQWRLLGKAPDWIHAVSSIGWFISILAQPGNIARYLLSRWTMRSASRQIQANVLAWFYVLFVRQVGYYAIEMNSGRLREGAATYRDAVSRAGSAGGGPASRSPARPAAAAAAATPAARAVAIAVVGQVKAGKSSVINALLGAERARTDVLPMTTQVDQYSLKLPDSSETLTLWDTTGYGVDETTATQFAQMPAAFENIDLVLLVMDVTSPARNADVQLLRTMAAWFGGHGQRKPPPVLGVLTHIDALTPVRQWTPPYDWQHPNSVKEQSIRQALDYNRDQFGKLLAGVVPVCSDVRRDRVYGVQQWLLPAMVALLDEARGCAVVRALHEGTASKPVRQVFRQLQNTGSLLLKAYLEG